MLGKVGFSLLALLALWHALPFLIGGSLWDREASLSDAPRRILSELRESRHEDDRLKMKTRELEEPREGEKEEEKEEKEEEKKEEGKEEGKEEEKEEEKGEEKEEEEEEGKEESESEEGVLERQEQEQEENETINDVDVGVACMLLGSVMFVMIIFYLVNSTDDDIRLYTWNMVSTTISIFTAVLIFQSFRAYILKVGKWYDITDEVLILVHIVHMAVWLAVMQLTIARISGAMFEQVYQPLELQTWVFGEALRADYGNQCDPKCIRNPNAEKKGIAIVDGIEIPVQKRQLELERRKRWMRCWATLLAHMSGFAAINAGASMQQLPMFRTSVLRSLLPVGIVEIILVTFFVLLKNLRGPMRRGCCATKFEGYTEVENEELEKEIKIRNELYEEEVMEAENDISSLSISFMTVQTVRYALTEHLPNYEGMEVPEVPHDHWCIVALYLWGIMFAGFCVGWTLVIDRSAIPPDDFAARYLGILMNTCAMVCSWCSLWATRMFLVKHPFLHHQMFMLPSMMGRVILALALSSGSMTVIWVLDKIEDRMKGKANLAKKVMKTVNTALGILVGFSWEHCFDGAVEAVATLSNRKILMKDLLCLMVVLVVVPAWRKFILKKTLELKVYKDERDGSIEKAEKAEADNFLKES